MILDTCTLVYPGIVHLAHADIQVVHNLVSYRTADEQCQVEVLITECVGPTKCIFRLWITDVSLVVIVDNSIRLSVRT